MWVKFFPEISRPIYLPDHIKEKSGRKTNYVNGEQEQLVAKKQ
jgi:hypothetical protein